VRWRVTKLKHNLQPLAVRHAILALVPLVNLLARLMSHHKSGGKTSQVLAKLGVKTRDSGASKPESEQGWPSMMASEKFSATKYSKPL
jgi:hypothetical protein